MLYINNTNAIDYLKWRGDLTFDSSPFNEVDMFILSQISTADFKGKIPRDGEIKLCDAFEEFFKIYNLNDSLGVLQSQYVMNMYNIMKDTARYKDLLLRHQVIINNKENEEQFSAITIVLPDGSICVSFRGTDDTIIGWKEDCNLSVYETVPAQKDAVDYLESEFLFDNTSKIRICGHSKGGNLAVYSAVSAPKEIRDRIISVYSFDGPGFQPSFFDKEGYYDIKDRIVSVWSQNSLVGVLLESAGRVEIIHSRVFGPLAHDGFNWTLMGTRFDREKELSEFSLFFQKLFNQYIEKSTEEEKIALFDELFDALLNSGYSTLTELTAMSPTETMKFFKSINGSKNVREFFRQIIRAIGKETTKKLGLVNPYEDMLPEK